MGLFGSKKTYVSSTVQNLAGPEKDRPNYLKTTVIGSVLADQEDIADTLQRAYLKGPGMKLRSFFRWSKLGDNFDAIGLPTATIGTVKNVNGYTIGTQIPVGAGQSVQVQTAEIGFADYSYWAEQYILANDPGSFDTEWTADINNDTDVITITWEDNSITSFSPADFDRDAQYIYAAYLVTKSGEAGPIQTGTTIDLGTGAFPSTSGWVLITSSTSNVPVTLHTTVNKTMSYSDGRPNETSTSTSTNDTTYVLYSAEYQRETYEGTDTDLFGPDETTKLVEYMYFNQTSNVGSTTTTDTTTEDIGGGVTKTTVTETITESLTINRKYRIDKQTVTIKSWTGPYMFIYRLGSGNAVLDAMLDEQDGDDRFGNAEFFPTIPIRMNNKFVSSTYLPDAYAEGKKGFKKAVDGKFDDVVDELSDAENLSDMDYIYVAFGVSANVVDNSCRKYIYEFFLALSQAQNTSSSDYAAWKAQLDAYQASLDAWMEWKRDQSNPFSSGFGDDEPSVSPYPTLPSSQLNLKANGDTDLNYQIQLSWQSISEVAGGGLAKAGAKNNEVWFQYLGADNTQDMLYYAKNLIPVGGTTVGRWRLYWQLDQDTWKALDIVGMVHRNYIYNGKYVETTLTDAINDDEDSGFIVPLHYPTLKSMSLVDTTQMSTACVFMVFNSYVVKKTGLLGSLFFKIFLIVVIIVVIVYAPQLAPTLANAAAATGTAIGLSGTAALVAGAAINAIAAMVITSVIMKASIAVFGQRLGFIIGTIASIVAMNGMTNLINGQGLTLNFGNMMSAQNLTMLTSAIGNVYARFVALDTMDTMKKTEELQEELVKKTKEISQLYADTFGYGSGIIDPLALLDSSNMLVESSSQFLDRTLMTGSDIAELSVTMLHSFADITLNLDLQ